MLLRTSRSSRNRNLSLILCCVGLTFVALHHKDVPRHIDGWKWHRASRIYGRDEEWPAGSFAAWQAKDDGKFFVPVDKDGLAVAWNDTATRDVPLKHPMHYLISDGERRWKRMLDRQSKTLTEAVEEYKRRYKRLPPKGFDDWFAYAKKKGTILVDEYDMLNSELLPFFALSPELVIKRRDELLTKEGTYHMNVTSGRIHLLTPNTPRSRSVHALTPGFEHLLPDMEIHTHVHDMGPYILDQELVRRVEKAVSEGTYIDEEELKKLESRKRNDRIGALKGCVEDSPSVLQSANSGKIFKAVRDTDVDAKSPRPFEFIHSLRPSLDFCQNPSLLRNQCLFTGTHTRDTELHPLLVQSKAAQAGGILPPSTYMYNSNDGQKVLPWDQRINQVYWRGHSTGCWHQINTWRESHRVRLHLLANTNRTTDGDRVDDEVDVLFEDEEQREEEDGQGGFGGQSVFGRSSWLRKKKHEKGRGLRRKTISRTEFNEAFMDVGLIGPALVCDSKDGTCEEMNANLEYLDPIHKGSKGEGHKYTVDVDGNGWSGRYRGLVASGSVVFKSTMFPEWMTERMVPYYHYVPIQHDFSDLYRSISFFTGIPNQDGSISGDHDHLAEQIANQSVDFVRNHWRWEDMQVYVFRLLLEYGRITSLDRNATSYHHNPSLFSP